ncbi:hypothetical protein WJX72_002967 [[Myrmecia] bisecta]|uniref:Uncharacterized protein n=1 Tax=[Myrmecia] bisecta TaxID=41462 RepID=A0AAW1Q0S7_9CHLO
MTQPGYRWASHAPVRRRGIACRAQASIPVAQVLNFAAPLRQLSASYADPTSMELAAQLLLLAKQATTSHTDRDLLVEQLKDPALLADGIVPLLLDSCWQVKQRVLQFLAFALHGHAQATHLSGRGDTLVRLLAKQPGLMKRAPQWHDLVMRYQLQLSMEICAADKSPYDPTTKKTVARDALPTIVAAVSRDNKRLSLIGLSAASHLLSEDAQLCMEFVRLGGVGAIVRRMAADPDENMRYECLETLLHLTSSSDSVCKEVMAVGGLEPVCALLAAAQNYGTLCSSSWVLHLLNEKADAWLTPAGYTALVNSAQLLLSFDGLPRTDAETDQGRSFLFAWTSLMASGAPSSSPGEEPLLHVLLKTSGPGALQDTLLTLLDTLCDDDVAENMIVSQGTGSLVLGICQDRLKAGATAAEAGTLRQPASSAGLRLMVCLTQYSNQSDDVKAGLAQLAITLAGRTHVNAQYAGTAMLVTLAQHNEHLHQSILKAGALEVCLRLVQWQHAAFRAKLQAIMAIGALLPSAWSIADRKPLSDAVVALAPALVPMLRPLAPSLLANPQLFFHNDAGADLRLSLVVPRAPASLAFAARNSVADLVALAAQMSDEDHPSSSLHREDASYEPSSGAIKIDISGPVERSTSLAVAASTSRAATVYVLSPLRALSVLVRDPISAVALVEGGGVPYLMLALLYGDSSSILCALGVLLVLVQVEAYEVHALLLQSGLVRVLWALRLDPNPTIAQAATQALNGLWTAPEGNVYTGRSGNGLLGMLLWPALRDAPEPPQYKFLKISMRRW